VFNIPTNVTQGINLNSLGASSGAVQSSPLQSALFQQAPVSQPPPRNQQPRQNQPPPQNNVSNGRGIILKKGQKTSLSAMNPRLDSVDIGLGWDVSGNAQYDLDSECFMIGSNGKVVGDDWFVFYNQPTSPDGAVRHCGDNKTGAGAGDDEIIHIQLSQVSPQVHRLIFIVTINEAREMGLNFSGVRNAYIRVVDKMNNRELIRFHLSDYYNTVTSMVVGEIYRHNGEWKFTPIGDGTQDDLYGLCYRYGVNVAG
jgi:tellurium resistance protein TerD